MQLHERIKAWREYRDMTIVEVAAKLGISTNAVHFWERDPNADDATAPNQKNLAALVEIFNISMPRFWGDVPKRKRAS